VTGGPGINQGTASINPGNGNLTLTPPGNAVEIKKAPSAFNVYEYFNSNSDYSNISLQAQVGGPYLLTVQSQPTSVSRDLNISAGGSGVVRILSNLTVTNGITAPVSLSIQTNSGSINLQGANGLTLLCLGTNTLTIQSVSSAITITPGSGQQTSITRLHIADTIDFASSSASTSATGQGTAIPTTCWGFINASIGGTAVKLIYFSP
jgi:hypothetical protein